MKNRKLTVYPSLRSLAILGTSATRLNLAIEVFARLVGRATNDLTLTESEWLLICEATNGTLWEGNFEGKNSLVFGIRDAIRFEQLDEKWGLDGEALIEKLEAISEIEAWAIVFGTFAFWQKWGGAVREAGSDEFWKIAERVKAFEPRS